MLMWVVKSRLAPGRWNWSMMINYKGEEASSGRQNFWSHSSVQPYEIIDLGVFFTLHLCKLMINCSFSVSKGKRTAKCLWPPKSSALTKYFDELSVNEWENIRIEFPPLYSWEVFLFYFFNGKNCSWQTGFRFFWIKYLESSSRDFQESEWTEVPWSSLHFIIYFDLL